MLITAGSSDRRFGCFACCLRRTIDRSAGLVCHRSCHDFTVLDHCDFMRKRHRRRGLPPKIRIAVQAQIGWRHFRAG